MMVPEINSSEDKNIWRNIDINVSFKRITGIFIKNSEWKEANVENLEVRKRREYLKENVQDIRIEMEKMMMVVSNVSGENIDTNVPFRKIWKYLKW